MLLESSVWAESFEQSLAEFAGYFTREATYIHVSRSRAEELLAIGGTDGAD
jgi:hypothetical protein